MNQRKMKKSRCIRSLTVLLMLCMILTACDNSAKRRDSDKNETDSNVTVTLGTPTPDPRVYLYRRTALTTDSQTQKRVTELFDEEGNVLEKHTEIIDSPSGKEWELTEWMVLTKKADGERIETTEHYVRGKLASKDVTTISTSGRTTTVSEYYDGEKVTMQISQTTENGVLCEYEKLEYMDNINLPEASEYIRYRQNPLAIPYEKKTGGAMRELDTYLSTDAWYLAATSEQSEFALVSVDSQPSPMMSRGPHSYIQIRADGNIYNMDRVTRLGTAEKTDLGYAVEVHGATPWDNSQARDFVLYFEDVAETKLIGAESDGKVWKRPVTDSRELSTDTYGSTKTEVLSPVTGEWYVAKEIRYDSKGRLISWIETDENGAVTKKTVSEYREEGKNTVCVMKSLVASYTEAERWYVVEEVFDTASGKTLSVENRTETGGKQEFVSSEKYEYDDNGRVISVTRRDEEGLEVLTTYTNEYRKIGR
ncbi:MAG: hypothetical protein J5645_04740 [Lachnospiraceae bacterium]|nr:hypothetical protein [Lachnospiraceae bacterium]